VASLNRRRRVLFVLCPILAKTEDCAQISTHGAFYESLLTCLATMRSVSS
jgi:hypothetical protein